jgi:hypothetical protein
MDADPNTSPYEPPTQEDVLADATAQGREVEGMDNFFRKYAAT